MQEYIAFDAHKRYTLAEREDVLTGKTRQRRIEHQPGAIRAFLSACPPGQAVAVEATGNWYWIISEIEQAGHEPRLVHPRKAKLMMGMINKTDKLDVHGLNRLQRNGTLPTVWIPPADLRDLRELTRTRMVMATQRTRLKNRLGATLAKYGLVVEGFTDSFGVGARAELEGLIGRLPEHTAWVSERVLAQLDFVQGQCVELEKRIKALVEETPAMRLLKSLPGVGFILSAVMALEIGDVERFISAEHLASYSGTVPRVQSSGGKTHYGKLRPDVNRYLKWAFLEAGNVVCLNHRCERWTPKHVSRLYVQVRDRRGHGKAVGAVARHLSESAWHVLKRCEAYRDRGLPPQEARRRGRAKKKA
jgi:transposase